jgi:hypothetical protein
MIITGSPLISSIKYCPYGVKRYSADGKILGMACHSPSADTITTTLEFKTRKIGIYSDKNGSHNIFSIA